MATALTHAALAPLAAQLGGTEAVEALDYAVLREILTFPGDVVVVDKLFYEIKLANVVNGYQVYDRFMRYAYSVTYDGSQAPYYLTNGYEATLGEMMFGRDLQDDVFIASAPWGSIFYINFTCIDNTLPRERPILVVVSPVDGITIRKADPTHGSLRRF